jgi:hypothetical protein
VTNCGTVPEAGVAVTQTVALADPAGVAPPPAKATGGSSRAVVSLRSGSSRALTMPTLTVATGHSYTLTVSVAVPPGQELRDGSSQEFLVQISG